MVKYYHEGYGKLIHVEDTSGINLANINPFRYKSYYYDTETGWYYLNSRYYDPITVKFVTMDQVEYLGASGSIHILNLFTYCEGNPVVYIDKNGNYAAELILQDLMFPLTKDIMFARRPGKKVKWNSEGYWEGKKDNYVWNPFHGGGMDRGNGEQGGHWDGETTKNRYREDGSPLPGNKTYDISNNTSYITGTTGSVIAF